MSNVFTFNSAYLKLLPAPIFYCTFYCPGNLLYIFLITWHKKRPPEQVAF